MRMVRGLVLVVAAAACGVLAFAALKNLWTGYQDSPTSTYIAIGSGWLILTALLLIGAVRTLRR